MLHAPDFLGYPDAIAMARDHQAIVQQGLQLKKASNRIAVLMGGREIRPVSAADGGFYKTPSKSTLKELVDELTWALDASLGNPQRNRCPQLNFDRLAILTAVSDLHHSATRDKRGIVLVESLAQDVQVCSSVRGRENPGRQKPRKTYAGYQATSTRLPLWHTPGKD